MGITFKAGLKSSFAVEFINSWLLVLLNDDLGIPKSIQINRYVKTDTEKKDSKPLLCTYYLFSASASSSLLYELLFYCFHIVEEFSKQSAFSYIQGVSK